MGFDQERSVGRGRTDGAAAEPDGERYEQLCGQCWKGKLCVTPSGESFPCVFSHATHLGDARQGLATLLQTPRLQIFRERLQELEQAR